MSTDLMAATVPLVVIKLHPLAKGPPKQFVIWPLLVCFKISLSRHLIAQELRNPSTQSSFQLSLCVLCSCITVMGVRSDGEGGNCGVKDHGGYFPSEL